MPTEVGGKWETQGSQVPCPAMCCKNMKLKKLKNNSKYIITKRTPEQIPSLSFYISHDNLFNDITIENYSHINFN